MQGIALGHRFGGKANRIPVFLMVALAIAMAGASAWAGTVAVTLPATLDGATNFNASVGWVFETTAAIEITSVGVWDNSASDLSGRATNFQIWDDEARTLVDQYRLDAGNTVLEGPFTTIYSGRPYAQTGQFRYMVLTTPLLLEADHRYVALATWPGNPYVWSFISPIDPDPLVVPGITFPREGRWNWSGYPDRVHGEGWFGANFKFNIVGNAVPTPAPALLGAVGLVALACVRCRRRPLTH